MHFHFMRLEHEVRESYLCIGFLLGSMSAGVHALNTIIHALDSRYLAPVRARVDSFSSWNDPVVLNYKTSPLICPRAGSVQPETRRNVDYMFVSPVERWWLWLGSALEATGKVLLLCGRRGERDRLGDE